MFENTKKFCDSFLDLGLPGFDLAVYKDGECILRHIGGYSDLENKIPMNGKERYNIYSCSKVITCVAAMQLWEKVIKTVLCVKAHYFHFSAPLIQAFAHAVNIFAYIAL